ncbi:M23 family metallopeptidase [Myxococcota bacterium]|nr:M23 family metallopeptidase [Myxococcota bacterium]MBU1900323.1 M23 family metallopeptidase [Myxococcota bacterium]
MRQRFTLPIALSLTLLSAPAQAVRLRDPVIGAKIITAYFDQGGTSDWHCGDNTYAGHRGTDFGIIGRFDAMDEGRDVVASAPGEVIAAHDGEFDRCTTGSCAGGGGYGNYVAIDHGDGVVTYSAHLREGSVSVSVGQRVACGQRIGQVGSSGNSTGPHLHFEVRQGVDRVDPFSGPCNGGPSYWVDQGAYNDLPSAECEDDTPPPPPPKPDIYLAAGLSVPARACLYASCEDFARGGRSAGVWDAWVEEEITWEIIVENRGEGYTAAEADADAAISLRYEIPPAFTVSRYLIESDHPAMDQRSWRRNDAMDNAHNPQEDSPGGAATLRLNGFSPGESKRVRLWLIAQGRTPQAPAALRAWINHIRDYYGERDGWEDAVEVNNGQSFNGGDLRVEARMDVLDPRAFLFDSSDPAFIEGWRACDLNATGALMAQNDALMINVLGGAPCVESPLFSAAAPGRIRVVLSGLSAASGAYGELFWATEDEPRFNADRYARFALSGEAATLEFDPGWSGVLTQLRLRPEINTDSARLEIHEVRLEDGPAPPPPDMGIVEIDAGEVWDMGLRPDALEARDAWATADMIAPDVQEATWDEGAAPDHEREDGGEAPWADGSEAPRLDGGEAPWTDDGLEGGGLDTRAVGGCQQSGRGPSGAAWLAWALLLGALWRRRRRA